MNYLSDYVLQKICNKLFYNDIVKLENIFDIGEIIMTRAPIYVMAPMFGGINKSFYYAENFDNHNSKCLDIVWLGYPFTTINDNIIENNYALQIRKNTNDLKCGGGYTLYCYKVDEVSYDYVLVPDTNKRIIHNTKQMPFKKIKLIKI